MRRERNNTKHVFQSTERRPRIHTGKTVLHSGHVKRETSLYNQLKTEQAVRGLPMKQPSLQMRTVKNIQAKPKPWVQNNGSMFDRMVSFTHRCVLNILDSLLANQIPGKGMVTIVCRIEIRKMAEC